MAHFPPTSSPAKHQYVSFPPYPSPKKSQRVASAKARAIPFLKPTYAKTAAGEASQGRRTLWPFGQLSRSATDGVRSATAKALKAPGQAPRLTQVHLSLAPSAKALVTGEIQTGSSGQDGRRSRLLPAQAERVANWVATSATFGATAAAPVGPRATSLALSPATTPTTAVTREVRPHTYMR